MAGIEHNVKIVGVNNPAEEVSADAWNGDHKIVTTAIESADELKILVADPSTEFGLRHILLSDIIAAVIAVVGSGSSGVPWDAGASVWDGGATAWVE